MHQVDHTDAIVLERPKTENEPKNLPTLLKSAKLTGKLTDRKLD